MLLFNPTAYKATASVHWICLAAVCKLHCTDMIHFDPQIGSLSVGPEADAQFVQLYVIFMNQLVTVLPITADIPKAYEQGSDDEQEFVQNLAIFLTGFLKVRRIPPSASRVIWCLLRRTAKQCWKRTVSMQSISPTLQYHAMPIVAS